MNLLLTLFVGCQSEPTSYAEKTVVSDLEQQLQELKEQIRTLEESCATQSDMSAVHEEIQNLSSSSVSTEELSNFVTQDDHAYIQETVENNSLAITSIESQLITNINDISANVTSIASNLSSITNLNAQVNTIEGMVQINTTSIQNHDASINTLQSDVTTLQNTTSGNTVSIQNNASAITTLQSNLSSVQNTVSNNSTDITALQSSVGTIESDYVTNTMLDAQWITVDTTWTIGPSSGADFASVHAAFEQSLQYKIHPKAVLTLSLEAGTHQLTETLVLHHTHGNRIEIIGNPTQPDSVVLAFSGTAADVGIEISNGSHIKLISGMSIVGDSTDTSIALKVHQNSSVNIQDLIIERWTGAGIFARNNSTIYGLNGSVEIKNNSGYGLMSRFGSVIRIDDLSVHHNAYGVDTAYSSSLHIPNADIHSHTGYGVSASWNSTVTVQGGSSNYNDTNGYQISYGSSANLYLSEAIGNGIFGYNSFNGGIILAQESISSNNMSYGYSAGSHSWIQAYNSAVSGNTHDYNVGTTDNGYNTFITQ